MWWGAACTYHMRESAAKSEVAGRQRPFSPKYIPMATQLRQLCWETAGPGVGGAGAVARQLQAQPPVAH